MSVFVGLETEYLSVISYGLQLGIFRNSKYFLHVVVLKFILVSVKKSLVFSSILIFNFSLVYCGPFFFIALDNALPSTTPHQPDTRSSAYQVQQSVSTAHSQQPVTRESNVYNNQQPYVDLPEPPTEIRVPSPVESGYAQSQAAQRDPNEGQLISFD